MDTDTESYAGITFDSRLVEAVQMAIIASKQGIAADSYVVLQALYTAYAGHSGAEAMERMFPLVGRITHRIWADRATILA